MAKYLAAIGTVGVYKCGANIFWQDWLNSPSPGVPVSRRAVDEYINYYFAKPGRMPHDIVIAIAGTHVNPLHAAGALSRVSPDEPVYAWLLAAARDIDAGLPMDGWVHSALTVTFTFRQLVTEDEKYYAAVNLREAHSTHAPNTHVSVR